MSNPGDVGLCARCRHARIIVSSKGSRFWLCGRAETDPRYPRYPRLPVLACAGHDAPNGDRSREPPTR